MREDVSHRPPRFFEALEPRLLMSGDVSGVVNSRGDLKLRGDNDDNQITVEQTDDGILVTGQNGTTINGQNEQLFADVTRDVRIYTKRGDDQVNLANMEVGRNLRVYTSHGDDTVDLLNVDVGRDLRVNVSRGDDVVHLFDGSVGRNLNDSGSRGTDVHTTDDFDVANRSKVRGFEVELNNQQGQQLLLAGFDPQAPLQFGGVGAMELKLDQSIELLGQRRRSDQEYNHAIDEMMEAIFTSNLVPLPTLGDDPFTKETTDDLFDDHLDRMNKAIEALNEHVGSTRTGTPGSRGAAADARNFLQLTQEAMEIIAQQTVQCNPENPDPVECQFLDADDEGGTIVDDVLGDIMQARQVRSPFPIFNFTTTGLAQEQVIVPGPIGPDEIALVVKEIQGVKVVVSPRVVPIWVEPWFARATIIGTRTVWVWEFVPAEMIKTISFANVAVDPGDPDAGREIRTDVDIQVILERQLLHFWQFAQKEIVSVPGG